ncbi:hypothetical protein BDV96DRAFT_40428 [Lophiotrema nucula]|uniref:Uncharacterized protein n=1 Tax=Lophiotrema nucula TaxID=690887 RepID=A0A6A5Z994_9PLEO|nr:hypothetical protein BDV96DRAFT_40428 [Lophiotrema nucula]
MANNGPFSVQELSLNVNFADNVTLAYLSITKFSLPLKSVDSLTINTQRDGESIDFPSLTWADNIDFSFRTNVSIPALATVNNA